MENQNVVKFGIGIKIWCIISVLGSTISAIVNLSLAIYSVTAICTASVILYIWLLLNKKHIAFYLLLIVAIVRLIIDIIVFKSPQAVLGLVNPLITYAFLHKYWKQME